MKRTLIHYAPFEAGDDPLSHPDQGTRRFNEVTAILCDFGLLTPGGHVVARRFNLTRGLAPCGYLWRVQWDDEAPSILKNPM